MKENTKKVLKDALETFLKGLIPLIATLAGSLVGIWCGGNTSVSATAMGAVVGATLYNYIV